MGKLDEAAFSSLIGAGCPGCGHSVFEVRSFVDRTVAVMLGTPNDEGRWAYDGEKLVDGAFEVRCAKCQHVAFSDDMCPRCNTPGHLAKALAEPSRLRVPKRCTSCNENELLVLAMLPAVAVGAKAKAIAEWDEPGYHVVAYACDACDHAVVAQTCPLCDAPGPLRARP